MSASAGIEEPGSGSSTPAPLDWNLGGNHPGNPNAAESAYAPGASVLFRTGRELPMAAPALELGADGMPSGKCLVSGAELGSMGAPVVIEHQGQRVRFS